MPILTSAMPFPKYLLVPAACISFLAASLQSASAESLREATGLQLWSLREAFKSDFNGALDSVKALGFKVVETAGTNSKTPQEFRKELESRGIKAVSSHFQYGALDKNVDAVIEEAKALGVSYIVCPWIPHTPESFGIEEAKKAAADFNKWGKAIREAGLYFAYHPHGFEFRPLEGGGTVFDTLAEQTNPDWVFFEMDVFWVIHPGADPVELLNKYKGRWKLMHLKDMRKGAAIGVYSGRAPKTDDVPLGTGQVNWPAVLEAAKKTGVQEYFIEDESPTVSDQIPVSLKYLEGFQK